MNRPSRHGPLFPSDPLPWSNHSKHNRIVRSAETPTRDAKVCTDLASQIVSQEHSEWIRAQSLTGETRHWLSKRGQFAQSRHQLEKGWGGNHLAKGLTFYFGPAVLEAMRSKTVWVRPRRSRRAPCCQATCGGSGLRRAGTGERTMSWRS